MARVNINFFRMLSEAQFHQLKYQLPGILIFATGQTADELGFDKITFNAKPYMVIHSNSYFHSRNNH